MLLVPWITHTAHRAPATTITDTALFHYFLLSSSVSFHADRNCTWRSSSPHPPHTLFTLLQVPEHSGPHCQTGEQFLPQTVRLLNTVALFHCTVVCLCHSAWCCTVFVFLCTFCSSCTTVCGSVSIVCYMSNNNTSNNAGTQCVSGKKEKYNTSTLRCHTFLCFAFTFCLNTDTEMQNNNTEWESVAACRDEVAS